MKKIIAFLLFLSLAIILLPGCEKDPIVDPVKPTTPYITTNPAANKVVPIGSDESISWESQGLSSITVKVGEEIKSNLISGSIPLDDIKEEIVVLIVGFDKNNEPIISKEIRFMPQSSTYPTPTINLTVSPDRLPQIGGSVTITWTTTNTDSVLFLYNGEWYPPYGSIQLTITDTTIFTFLAKGKGGQTSGSIIVPVESVITPPAPTIEELLCLGPWKLVQVLTAYSPSGPWQELDIYAECQQDDRLIFHPNNTSTYDRGEILCPGESNRYSNSSWQLVGNMINNYYEILIINSDSVVWHNPSVEIQEDGVTTVDIIVKSIFIHP